MGDPGTVWFAATRQFRLGLRSLENEGALMRHGILTAILCAAGMTSPLYAHHAMSAFFDFNQRFTQEGTLTGIDWRFPHVQILVDFEIDGRPASWAFEGPPPAFFLEREVGKEAFEASIGMIVAVDASRARDGTNSGLLRQITLADGTTVSACPQNC